MNELLSDPKAIAIGLMGTVMTLLAWMGKRFVRRLDEVERHHVTRAALESMLTSMRIERREMHTENKETLDSIATKVDDLRDRVAAPVAVLTQRVSTLEDRVQELKDFKHEHCEPAVRYVNFLKDERDRSK